MRVLVALGILSGILAQAQQIKTGYFRGQLVHYKVVDGIAVTEGDILLGQEDQLATSAPDGGKAVNREAIGRVGDRYRWAGGVVPYVIDPALPNQQRVVDAVKHWNDNTAIQLVARTDQANYIRFVRKPGSCSSFVGMVSLGAQNINLGDDCTAGNAIHEIGHAVGLYHEQSRQDRDYYIQVNYSNLDKREFIQYDQQLTGADDLGGYDYGSIMHYPVSGFTRNGQPGMLSIPIGIPIGQRTGLSPGDLDAVKRLYNQPITATTIATFPAGLNITVDGETYVAPRSFQWAAGTRHTVDVPGVQADSPTTRNVFGRWSDDGAQGHTITVSPSTTVYTANFMRQYRIGGAPSPSAGGSIQFSPPSDGGYYPAGTVVEVTAVPNSGYSFLSWSGLVYSGLHGLSANPARFTINQANLRYDASFTRSPLTTITSEPPGLKVTVDGTSTLTPQNYAWSSGSTHNVGASTAAQTNDSETTRYLFQTWSDGGDGAHAVTATADASTLTAAFKTQYLVLTDTFPVTGGTLQSQPVSTDNFYDSGTELTLVPLGSGNFKFVNWSDDLTGSDAPGKVIIDDQKLITANFAPPRQLTSSSIVNAANFILNGGIAPGEIVTIFGLEFGPTTLVGSTINPATQRLETTLSGTRVLFDGVAAPLVYVSANQISAIVPYSVAGKTATRVSMSYNGLSTNTITVPVVPSAPALFTYDSSGRGPAALLNQNGSVNTQTNPAQRGSTIVLFATGEGETTPTGADGKPAATPLPRPVLPVRVLIGGHEGIVSYAGGAPGLTAGVLQVNVQIPNETPSGAVPISLLAGTTASPANVTIWVQ